MSASRRTDDTSRIRKGLQYDNDSVSPNSPVKHTSKGVLFDTRKESSETRQQQQRYGKRTKKKGAGEGVGDKDARSITKDLSEITRTNDVVIENGKKETVSNEAHGVLRVPESVRTVPPLKKGPSIIQSEKNVVTDGTLVHEIAACETDLNNLVSRWSGDPVKFQHITTMW